MIGYGLYLHEDYRQSINYGLKFLSFTNKQKAGTDPNLHILQIDVIGASYFRLGNIDSSKYYYQKLLNTLIKNPNTNPNDQQLWIAIAKGNLGRILTLQNQDEKALHLIQEHLDVSKQQKVINNMASTYGYQSSSTYYKLENYNRLFDNYYIFEQTPLIAAQFYFFCNFYKS